MKKSSLIIAVLLVTMMVSCNAQEEQYKDVAIYSESNTYNSNDLDEKNDRISKKRSSILTDVVADVSPAIVGINVTEVYRQRATRQDMIMEYFFGGRSSRYREYEVKGLGSGYIISPDGYILTNHHVAGNASKIVVSMTDGKKYEAEIIGADMVSDVCLLKINAEEDLPYLKLADSDDIQIGEWVLAFGNPFGLFDKNSKPTVTLGIVSNNCISFMEESTPHNRIYKNMIQTDAAISSGNSGGPLVNADGKVIGMNTIIWSTAQSAQGAGSIGIGFAIPINRVKKIVDLLIVNGTIERNFNPPMQVKEMNERIARYLGTELREAVVVYSYKEGSQPDRLGIKLGDIILEANGTKIVDEEDYNIVVGDAVRGDKIELILQRGEKILKKTIKL